MHSFRNPSVRAFGKSSLRRPLRLDKTQPVFYLLQKNMILLVHTGLLSQTTGGGIALRPASPYRKRATRRPHIDTDTSWPVIPREQSSNRFSALSQHFCPEKKPQATEGADRHPDIGRRRSPKDRTARHRHADTEAGKARTHACCGYRHRWIARPEPRIGEHQRPGQNGNCVRPP